MAEKNRKSGTGSVKLSQRARLEENAGFRCRVQVVPARGGSGIPDLRPSPG